MGEINFNMLSYNVSRVLAFQYVTNAKKSAWEDYIHFHMLIFFKSSIYFTFSHQLRLATYWVLVAAYD